jgi:hypothetical protein
MKAMISLATIAARAGKEAAKGLAFAALASVLSYAVALWGFGKAYYLGVLIPLALVLFLLVAWLSHLRRDRFMTDYRQGEGSKGAASLSPEHPAEATATAPPGAELFAPRDDRIIPRAGAPMRGERSEAERDEANRGAIRALLWGALWLGILAAILYSFAGVGASYYPR